MSDLCTPLSLGTHHGYCFSDDQVSLHAALNLGSAEGEAGQSWWLQLWASPTGFAAGLNGTRIAEAWIPPQTLDQTFQASSPATPPAGNLAQHLALALVRRAADGSTQLLDLSAYPETVCFPQPQLCGSVQATWNAGQLELQLDALSNPRAADNLSGSLALEIWQHAQAGADGNWTGQWLAGYELGQLAGQQQQAALHLSFPIANAPVSGLSLLLREWTPQGYLTRDFRTLELEAPAAVVATAGSVESAGSVQPAESVESIEPIEPAESAEPVAAVAPAKSAEPVEPAVAAPPPARNTPARLCINHAPLEALAGLKGLPAKLAQAIVADRPYSKLSDLLRIKGFGSKTLGKLQSQLCCEE